MAKKEKNADAVFNDMTEYKRMIVLDLMKALGDSVEVYKEYLESGSRKSTSILEIVDETFMNSDCWNDEDRIDDEEFQNWLDARVGPEGAKEQRADMVLKILAMTTEYLITRVETHL